MDIKTKYEIIRSHTKKSLDSEGLVEVFDYPAAMDEWSNQQNATLIEQNRKLRETIKYCINDVCVHASDKQILRRTLKDTENGK